MPAAQTKRSTIEASDFSVRERLDLPPKEVEDQTVDTKMIERRIRAVLRTHEKRLKKEYPILQHQDALGLLIYSASFVMIFGLARGYLSGVLPAWATILLLTFPISTLHELEHDLIHDMYFKHVPGIQNIMFAGIWVMKMNANPWDRKVIHLKHHRVSGQTTDVEERLIGMGLPFGFKRLLIALTPLGSALQISSIKKAEPYHDWYRTHHLVAPAVFLFHLLLAGAALQAYVPGWFAETCVHFFVLIGMPNIIRQACLVLISSYTHYYDDIPANSAFHQNQVLDSWLVWPMQAMCWMFGRTHILHHYWPSQSFYMRSLVSDYAIAECKRSGVRFNDFGIVARANRWGEWNGKDAVDKADGSSADDYNRNI